MNRQRLNELTDLTNEIKKQIDMICTEVGAISYNPANNEYLLLGEDFGERFQSYTIHAKEWGNFPSELTATVNGVGFHTFSDQRLPDGVYMLVISNPERMAM